MLRTRERDQRPAQREDTYQRVAVLHLRPPPTEEELTRDSRRSMRVTWEGDIEEHPNQRVSKSCCVFHKKKLFGESSSDEDSSSCSSDDDDDVHEGVHQATANGGSQTCCEHATEADAKKKHHRHPPCTKDHCYCGTRFH